MAPNSVLVPFNTAQRPHFQSLQLIPFSHGLNAYDIYHGLNHGIATSSVSGNIASDVGSIIEEGQANEGHIITQNQDSSSNANTSPPPLLCEWPDCKRPGPFSSKGTLRRHVNTQHLAPRSFKCPHRECTMTFNRKDNLDQHLRSDVHWKKI
ncbi:Zinc finger C2H2 [Penicillium waksmanii]|uniref:Zinc finger C2H2 n=1 Tax=Penicillium waksmanii TaxID=69791 RepID=UPI0025479EB0|nr:Zinc finger C2H2 [Penicillium waksmanii]KAJ5984490.1 Zinc finger C2H2 [Penicillium waksmanii]